MISRDVLPECNGYLKSIGSLVNDSKIATRINGAAQIHERILNSQIVERKVYLQMLLGLWKHKRDIAMSPR